MRMHAFAPSPALPWPFRNPAGAGPARARLAAGGPVRQARQVQRVRPAGQQERGQAAERVPAVRLVAGLAAQAALVRLRAGPHQQPCGRFAGACPRAPHAAAARGALPPRPRLPPVPRTHRKSGLFRVRSALSTAPTAGACALRQGRAAAGVAPLGAAAGRLARVCCAPGSGARSQPRRSAPRGRGRPGRARARQPARCSSRARPPPRLRRAAARA